MYFCSKTTKHLLSGGGVVGLVRGAVVLLIQDLLSVAGNKNILVVFEEDNCAKEFFNSLSFFQNKPLYYPQEQNKFQVPGFELERNRQRANVIISGVLKGGVCCVSSKRAAIKKDINKKAQLDSMSLSVGETQDFSFLEKRLLGFGYKKVDFVYHGGEFSFRGDIVDIFPENSKNPLRVSFEYGVVDTISSFSADTQRSYKSRDHFNIYSLVGKPINKGKNLIKMVNWSFVFYLKQNLGLWSFFSNPENQTLKSSFKTFPGSFFTDAGLSKYLNKNKKDNNYVFITNKKRKAVLSALGCTTISGFLPGGEGVKSKQNTYLVDGVSFKQKPKITKHKPLLLNSLSDIEVGDAVVHVSHGVGCFLGLVSRGKTGHEKEFIQLKYLDGSLFVPLDRLDLIHRYISPGGEPRFSFLGKSTWTKEVDRVKKSVEEFSQTLVDVYTSRNLARGFKYSRGAELLGALKSSFPYQETKDQKKTIEEVQLDLNKDEPMDRLVCGDVGFGKTEVALRAIVRVSSSSKQCLFLCPTTVLADQHYITAKERLGPLGIRVGLLSRFATKQKQKRVLADLLVGCVDVVVGTHRLLSDDVVIPSLGLLIIDEEHRFGVKHKEKIRQLRFGLDVLSLSATPIPRTLQQSLLGIRDISMIETPPITRKPIETRVEYFSWEKIKDRINKELLRGGQVYFVHNRVQTIDYYANKIQGFFPGAVVRTIHGQLKTKTLEKNLLSFFSGDISVLVCSTIIESGLDVGNANCIIINDAQNLGLSQLYQIRGRVGRGNKQAHCFLLIPKKTKLNARAFKRLKTIEKHTSLGSGYKIANSDLNIRGAGSVFGFKQSGQLIKVGFEYYNHLLKKSIDEKLNRKKVIERVDVYFEGKALIPKYYIKSEVVRLSFYNKINSAETKNDIDITKEELRDRFGPIPEEAMSFLTVSLIRIFYKKTNVLKIKILGDSLRFEIKSEHIKEDFVESVVAFGQKKQIQITFEERGGKAVVFFMLSPNQKWSVVLIDSLSVFLN